jgi:hypothetical protein
VEGEMRLSYIIRCVNRREGALEAVHCLAANIGLVEVSTHQVVVILDCGQLVVFRGELVRIVAEERALAGKEVVRVVGVADEVKVGGCAARLGLAWPCSASLRSWLGGSIAALTGVNLV